MGVPALEELQHVQRLVAPRLPGVEANDFVAEAFQRPGLMLRLCADALSPPREGVVGR